MWVPFPTLHTSPSRITSRALQMLLQVNEGNLRLAIASSILIPQSGAKRQETKTLKENPKQGRFSCQPAD
ncbi:hypothetical protein V6Z12_D13G134200 [Gossypium hirsutum]